MFKLIAVGVQFSIRLTLELINSERDSSLSLTVQGCKSFRFSLISDFFIKSNFKGARANLKTTF